MLGLKLNHVSKRGHKFCKNNTPQLLALCYDNNTFVIISIENMISFTLPLLYNSIKHARTTILLCVIQRKFHIIIWLTILCNHMINNPSYNAGFHVTIWYICRADSRFVPSQWETALLCNSVSHWLGANVKSALYMVPWAFIEGHSHKNKGSFMNTFLALLHQSIIHSYWRPSSRIPFLRTFTLPKQIYKMNVNHSTMTIFDKVDVRNKKLGLIHSIRNPFS